MWEGRWEKTRELSSIPAILLFASLMAIKGDVKYLFNTNVDIIQIYSEMDFNGLFVNKYIYFENCVIAHLYAKVTPHSTENRNPEQCPCFLSWASLSDSIREGIDHLINTQLWSPKATKEKLSLTLYNRKRETLWLTHIPTTGEVCHLWHMGQPSPLLHHWSSSQCNIFYLHRTSPPPQEWIWCWAGPRIIILGATHPIISRTISCRRKIYYKDPMDSFPQALP